MSSTNDNDNGAEYDEEITAWVNTNLTNILENENILLKDYISEIHREGKYDVDEILESLFPMKSSTKDTPQRAAIQQWLRDKIKGIAPTSVELYSRELMETGFDSATILDTALKRRNIQFMKRGHKRALTKLLSQENHPGFETKTLEDENLKTLTDAEEEYRKQTFGMKGAAQGWENIKLQMTDALS